MKKALSVFLAFILIALPFSSNAAENISLDMLALEQTEPSEYGCIQQIFRDSDGNIVDFSDFRLNGLPYGDSQFNKHSISAPSSYDSRDYGYVSPVRNQGYSGNCSIFTLTGTLESSCLAQGIKDINDVDFSEAHYSWFLGKGLINDENDPCFGEGYNSDNPYNEGYHSYSVITAATRRSGFAREESFPFYPWNLSSMGNYSENERYNNDCGVFLTNAENFNNVTDVKKQIMEHGSVSVAYYFDPDFLYNNGSSHSYYYGTATNINHMSIIVGWDDSYPVSNFNSDDAPQYGGAWLVKNSWGTNFGDGGYFWISYYDKTLKSFVSYEAASSEDYYGNYTYNAASWSMAVNHTSSASIANVFKTDAYEILTDISTYVLRYGSTINISVYTDLPSTYSSPVQGTRALTWSTDIDNYGYHTIPLPEEIHLEPDTYFSVVVEFVGDGNKFSIPIEKESTSSPNVYTSGAKESYFKFPDYASGWRASSAFDVDNCYLQALTKCNHQTFSTSSEATCTENGFTLNTCSQCNKILSSSVIKAKGHSIGNWSEGAFDSEKGSMTYVKKCDNCAFSETRTSYPQIINLTNLVDMIYERLKLLFDMLF